MASLIREVLYLLFYHSVAGIILWAGKQLWQATADIFGQFQIGQFSILQNSPWDLLI